jgi:tRNA G46 methylase TrmB
VSYVRTLSRYGKIKQIKLDSHAALYLKSDVDNYIVESRGEKVARINRQKAVDKKRQGKRPKVEEKPAA